MLLHLIDCTQDDPAKAYETIRNELREYGEGLAEKEEILALNKVDALGDELAQDVAKSLEKAVGKKVYKVSAVSGQGVDQVLFALHAVIAEYRENERQESAEA